MNCRPKLSKKRYLPPSNNSKLVEQATIDVQCYYNHHICRLQAG